jgi:hypothetical protein
LALSVGASGSAINDILFGGTFPQAQSVKSKLTMEFCVLAGVNGETLGHWDFSCSIH